jgi:hypothetical protein
MTKPMIKTIVMCWMLLHDTYKPAAAAGLLFLCVWLLHEFLVAPF